MKNITQKERRAIKYIVRAIHTYKPTSIQVGFSGGTDSMVVTHLVMNYFKKYGAEVFHVNTGIGIEKTRKFVRETCKKYDWTLNEIFVKEDCNQDYDKIVEEHGFPGPAQHTKMYIRLKERGINELKRRTTNWGEKILLCTGIRHDESFNRMQYTNDIIQIHNNTYIWCNPIYWFSPQDKYEYYKKYDLPKNEVTDLLGFSGECLCGAYAHKGELELIGLIEPETKQRIQELEKKLYLLGNKRCEWESGKELDEKTETEKFMPMCVGCTK